jgi:hypothetical protein
MNKKKKKKEKKIPGFNLNPIYNSINLVIDYAVRGMLVHRAQVCNISGQLVV